MSDSTQASPTTRSLRELRAARQLSIGELGQLANVAATTISTIEVGERMPGRTVARRLAAALGVDTAAVHELDMRGAA